MASSAAAPSAAARASASSASATEKMVPHRAAPLSWEEAANPTKATASTKPVGASARRAPAAIAVALCGTTDAPDGEPVEAGIEVALRSTGRSALLELPTEQFTVEGHRGVDVGLNEVDPTGHADRIRLSLLHGVTVRP